MPNSAIEAEQSGYFVCGGQVHTEPFYPGQSLQILCISLRPISFDWALLAKCSQITRLGINESSQIRSINSSCSCVAPSLISYLTPTLEVNRAVLLHFKAEKDTGLAPAQFLGVDVCIDLVNEKKQSISLRFLRTLRGAKESGEEESKRSDDKVR